MECDISKMVDEEVPPFVLLHKQWSNGHSGTKFALREVHDAIKKLEEAGEHKHGGWLLRRCGKHFTCVTPYSRPSQLSTKRNPFEYDVSPWRKRSRGHQQCSAVAGAISTTVDVTAFIAEDSHNLSQYGWHLMELPRACLRACTPARASIPHPGPQLRRNERKLTEMWIIWKHTSHWKMANI